MKKSLFPAVVIGWLLTTASSFPGNTTFAATYTLTLDGNIRQGTIPHFWSTCVGTGTMEYCLKPAWTQAARIGVKEAGFKYVRGHGILIHGNNDDKIRLGGSPNWNFSIIDQIYDTVLACGLKPIVELSFMPISLQSVSGKPNSPPNNYSNWKNLIAAFVKHVEDRYGVEEVRSWYWEVWNEYDYEGFWTSDAAHYYTLYDSAAAGIRSVDTNIIIGGPATTNSGPIEAFWNNCNKDGIKFVSNHFYGYGTDNTALPTNISADNRLRSDFIKKAGKKLLSFNTEFNSSYSGQGGNPVANCMSMDNHRNAPFVAKVVKLIVNDCIDGKNLYPDVLSYWSISDCFDEWWGNNSNSWVEGNNYKPFGQVFGLINYQGIRKATFNAYAMLHKMGTIGLQMTGGSGDADGVDGFATVNADSTQVAVMIYSYYNDLTTKGADDSAKLVIGKLPFPSGVKLTVNHYRVDSLHSNPYGVWMKLNSPVTPSTAQWDSLKAHQNLEMIEQESTIQYTGESVTKTIAMPRWSVSLLTYVRDATGTVGAAAPRREIPVFSVNGVTLTVSSLVQGPVEVSVYTADGRLVKQMVSTQRSIDVGNSLTRGMYLAHVKAGTVRYQKKIVVY